jgi:uncharacterized protein involved in outer membrane biogenesis
MTGEVQITVGKVILPHTVLGGVKTKICAAGGRFAVNPLQFKAGGGEVEVALEVRREGRAATVVARARVNQADLYLLLREKRAQGKAEAEIDVTARGTSIAALMGSLNGRVLFAVRGFRVENQYVKLLGSDLIGNLSQIFAAASEEASTTEINCLVSGFDIADGHAQVTAMVADTKEMVVIGRGQVNLEEERLDLTISPYPKKGVAGLSLSFGELTRAFRLGGTFAEPSLRIDPIQTALTIGKAVGGVFLIGPAGAALALAGQSAGDEDICLAAMEAAREGSKKKTGEKQGSDAEQGAGSIREAIHSIGESVGKFFKKLSTQPSTPVDMYGGGR